MKQEKGRATPITVTRAGKGYEADRPLLLLPNGILCNA